MKCLDVWLGTSNLLAEEAAQEMEDELYNHMSYTPEIYFNDLYKRFNVQTADCCQEMYYNHFERYFPVRDKLCDIQYLWNVKSHPLSRYSSFSIDVNCAKNFKQILPPQKGQSLVIKYNQIQNNLADKMLFNLCELYDNRLFMRYYADYNWKYKKSLPNVEKYIIDKNKRQYEVILKQPSEFVMDDICWMGYADNYFSSNQLPGNFEFVRKKLTREEGWFSYPFDNPHVSHYYNELWQVSNYSLDRVYYLG